MDMAARENKGLAVLEDPLKVVERLRGLADRLRASLSKIPCYRLFSVMRFVPTEESVIAASQGLVGGRTAFIWVSQIFHRRIVAESLKLTD
jgi:hypothetical protein